MCHDNMIFVIVYYISFLFVLENIFWNLSYYNFKLANHNRYLADWK